MFEVIQLQTHLKNFLNGEISIAKPIKTGSTHNMIQCIKLTSSSKKFTTAWYYQIPHAAESRISLCCMGFTFSQVIDIAKTNTSVICCFDLPHLTSMDWKPGHSMHLPFFNRVHTLWYRFLVTKYLQSFKERGWISVYYSVVSLRAFVLYPLMIVVFVFS